MFHPFSQGLQLARKDLNKSHQQMWLNHWLLLLSRCACQMANKL